MEKLAQIFLEHEEDEFELTGMFYQVMALMVRESDEPQESYEQQYFQRRLTISAITMDTPLKSAISPSMWELTGLICIKSLWRLSSVHQSSF